MDQPSDRDKILSQARAVEPALWEQHIRAFVQSFVLKDRQDRWLHLLLKPTQKTHAASHKLRNDLNRSCCSDLRNPFSFAPDRLGVYDDFSGEPKYITFEQSMYAAPMLDGIWSMIPGEMALFFYHEGEILLCASEKYPKRVPSFPTA